MMMYTCLRGDDKMDFSFKLRCFVFEEWIRGGVKIKDICKKYGMSRKWFYKFKKRFERDGPRRSQSRLHRRRAVAVELHRV